VRVATVVFAACPPKLLREGWEEQREESLPVIASGDWAIQDDLCQ